MTKWRLIDTGPLDGPTNMAIDEALLSCFDPETTTPVLRLYGWNPPALSLGRFQQAADVLDPERCRQSGVPIVRRITGGGVIFHTEELTYSLVCAPHQIPPAASIKESFRVLTTFLLNFYKGLGLTAAYAVDQFPVDTTLGQRTPFCFAGKETYDILIHGRKIGGNAQRRLKNLIFQHGSIPLRNMVSEGAKYLREPLPGLKESVTSLDEQGITCDAKALMQLLASAFLETIAITLEPSALTPREEAKTRLLLEKYQSDGWNLEGLTPPDPIQQSRA